MVVQGLDDLDNSAGNRARAGWFPAATTNRLLYAAHDLVCVFVLQGDSFVSALSRCSLVRHSDTLSVLDLSENSIRDEGAAVLASVLQQDGEHMRQGPAGAPGRQPVCTRAAVPWPGSQPARNSMLAADRPQAQPQQRQQDTESCSAVADCVLNLW